MAAEPAKLQHWDEGKKLSDGAPRRLFKYGFAKTSVIKAKGSCPSAGRCSETLWQVLSCGVPLSIYGTCINISWEAALLTPASSFCLDLCFLATRGCEREGKKTLVSHGQGAAASQDRISSATLCSLATSSHIKLLHIPCVSVNGILASQLFQIYHWELVAF